jgi:hypothetical protein
MIEYRSGNVCVNPFPGPIRFGHFHDNTAGLYTTYSFLTEIFLAPVCPRIALTRPGVFSDNCLYSGGNR